MENESNTGEMICNAVCKGSRESQNIEENLVEFESCFSCNFFFYSSFIFTAVYSSSDFDDLSWKDTFSRVNNHP